MLTIQPAEIWTEDEWNSFTDWLQDLLKTNTVTVTFTKKDGTDRVMNCTLNPDMLPVVELKEDMIPKPERKKSTTTIAVYDIDSNGWRSFTIKSITNVATMFDLIGASNDSL